jgi:hypothetical protein
MADDRKDSQRPGVQTNDPGSTAVGGAIGEAIKLAYSVIEDQIVQGRRAAADFSQGKYTNAEAEGDVRHMVNQLLNVLKQGSVITFDLLASLIVTARLADAQRAATDVEIDNRCGRPVQVNHKLVTTSPNFEPSIPALHAADRNVAPLTNVRFAATRDNRPMLVVNIPENQPAGTYTGVIVDRKTNEPGGFIRITVT